MSVYSNNLAVFREAVFTALIGSGRTNLVSDLKLFEYNQSQIETGKYFPGPCPPL